MEIKIQTSRRVISILRLTPLDQLILILKHMTESKLDDPANFNELEEFITKYSLQETCSFLVQIISDERNGVYKVAQKMQSSLRESRALRKDIRLQTSQNHPQARAMPNQNLNRTAFSPSPMGTAPRSSIRPGFTNKL
mmetsp:Transcript_11796/g.18107  ORF Transcript_11796/g.18107 Transcript_11796/m.18107 type:complete len:138 (+) Transcript_11796:1880-2293(+)